MSSNTSSVEPSFGFRITGLGTVVLTIRLFSELLRIPPSEFETHIVTNTETVQKTLLESDRLMQLIKLGAIPVFPLDFGLPNPRNPQDHKHLEWLAPVSSL